MSKPPHQRACVNQHRPAGQTGESLEAVRDVHVLPATWRALVEVLRVDEVTSNDSTSRMPGGYDPNFVHCPSETTSTEPSTTLMAVCSSMA